MADWGTRAGTLTNLRDKLEDAKEYQQWAADRTTWMMAKADDSDWLAAFAFCNQAFEAVRSALANIYYIKTADPLEFAITYFLETYTTDAAVEYDLTWEKIIAAWDESTFEGWGRTVLAIDQMRTEIFNHPLTRFGPLPIFQ